MRLLVAWLLPLARGAFDGDARFEAACAAPARRRFAVMACACTNEGPSSPTQHLGAMGELARATALGDMLAAALPRGADGGRAADAVLLLSGYYSDASVSPRDATGRFTVSRSPGPRAPRSGHEQRGFWGAAGPMAGMRVLNSTTLKFDGRRLDLGRWDRLVAVDRSTLHFAIKSEQSDAYRDTFWNHERMQERSDGQCTSMKIFAWRFTAYDGVLLLDSDVCPLAPLAPFLDRACDAGVAFLASNERRRGVSYLGLNSHMARLGAPRG